MRLSIIFAIVMLFALSVKGQNNYTAIKISQSLRGGDGKYTVIIGSNSNTIKYALEHSSTSDIFVTKHLVNENTVKVISNFVSNKCNSKFPISNSDGFSIVITLIGKNGTLMCHLANRDIIKPYFRDLISLIRKSTIKSDKKAMVDEMQKIINYATLPEYTNEQNKILTQ